MRFLKALFVWTFMLALLATAGAAAGWFWYNKEIARPGPLARETIIEVDPGETLSGVAARLERDGVIRDARLMQLKSRIEGTELDIKSGEYIVEPQASLNKVLSILIEGRAVLYSILLKEGLTTQQMLREIEANEHLSGPMPDPLPPEGALLPDTYMFNKGMTRVDLVEKIMVAQKQVIEELWPTRQENLPFDTPEEAIILASVVEKESGKPEDRNLVAGLFVGRLRNGMRLQSDPTIVYGISKGEPLYNRQGERRTLLRSEIDRHTEWNTYQVDGLPITAIANPGRDSIAAVLNPPATDYVFFVAECKDGVITGDHVFSKTNYEHNRAVAAYRECERREIERERAN
jgi:UPF0755 protein